MKVFSWPLFLVGVWVLLSPWVLGFSSINILVWSNTLAGVVVLFLSLRISRQKIEE